jgi:hypothetical protein
VLARLRESIKYRARISASYGGVWHHAGCPFAAEDEAAEEGEKGTWSRGVSAGKLYSIQYYNK